MITENQAIAQVCMPQVWDKVTNQANVGDYFHIPYTPVFQVVEKDVLKSGRVWLKVMPMSCSYTEEWVVEPEPAVEPLQPQQAQVDKTAAQPAGFTGDSTSCQLRPSWEAMEEFKQGRAHGLADASEKLEPMRIDASCPYSSGYLEGYNSFIKPQPQPAISKPPQWSVIYNPTWNWYEVWVGERCCLEKASSYEEGERIAQKYIAAAQFWQEHRQNVMAAYVC